MDNKVFDVRGKFIIPGSRRLGSISIKVVTSSYQQASKLVAPILNEKYAKDLPAKSKFSNDFALMHCQIDIMEPVAKKETTTA